MKQEVNEELHKKYFQNKTGNQGLTKTLSFK